jgi:TonB-dependent starch-binding outer membrane protein SusC
MKQFLLVFSLVFIPLFSFSQQIEGKVLDESGIPLAGVNLVCSFSKNYAITDFDGNFTLITTKDDMVTVSYVGFKTQTLKPSPLMNIVLVEEVNKLNDVIVIGYGTKKAGAITGSIVQIKSDDIVKNPAQSAIQAIQGKAAGVNIVTNDEPGGNPSIRIRGLGTLIAGRDPLYVIDGLETNSLNGLSPNDIESLDILKDASSLAIYGQKGSNGVVIVTTKKGKKGEIKVNYSSYVGKKQILTKVKLADSQRYAYYNDVAYGSATYFSFDQPYNTDWLKEITTTGETSNNSISFSGGSDSANYFFGATNYKEKGILKGTEFERTNINVRNQFRAFDSKLKISQNLNVTISNGVNKPTSAFTNAYKQSPIVPVYFPNGRYGVPLRNPDTGLIDINGSDRFNNVGNPVAQLDLTNNKNRTINLFGNIEAELKLHKNITYTSRFGMAYFTNKSFDYFSNKDFYLAQNATKDVNDFIATFGSDNPVIYNTLNQNRSEGFNWNWDNYVTFQKNFGENDIKIIAGMSRTTKGEGNYLSGTRTNVPEQPNYWNLDLSNNNTLIAPGSVVNNNNYTPIVSLSYFGRVEYEYASKYLASVIVRREGVSNFQNAKQWAVFPAFSAGWIISKEDFLSDSKFINFLKLRGGYGEVGNSNTGASLNSIAFNGSNYSFGNPNSVINSGLQVPNVVDPNLTWETMKEIDFGLDFKVLNNLSGTIEYYNRNSSNVILPVQLPPVLSPNAVFLNTGTVNNTGYELSLNWDSKINDNWSYSIGGNISSNKNVLKKVDNSYFADYIGGDLSNGQYTKQVLVGESLGSFYVFPVTGYNSDGAFTYGSERVNAGSYIPNLTFGTNFNVTYKNVDLSVSGYGVSGNKIYNGKKAQRFNGENIESSILDDFWLPTNTNAANPKPFNDVPIASTYYIEDGSFFRINNITLGYTFPKLNKSIEKVRLYFTALNPFIFTKYSGYSPEIVGNSNSNPLGTAGIELDAYPTNKTFLLGLNVNL